MKAHLFAYGQLKHNISPPKTMMKWEHGAVPGVIYDLGDDAALVSPRLMHKNVAKGDVLTIDDEEFESLDKIEREVGYKRIRLKEILSNNPVWAYLYTGRIPGGTKAVEEWKPNHDRK